MYNYDYLKEALKEAKIAFNDEEVPVGAIIVKDDKIIGRGHNQKEALNDPTAHAEIIAIRQAAEALGNWRLNSCSLYVTLEPCIMCASAILQSRISNVYIGTYDIEGGGFGSIANIPAYYGKDDTVRIYWDYNEECEKIMKDFFAKVRNRKSLINFK